MTDFKPAIITPYYDEDLDVLRRCHQSCLAQRTPVRHFFVADGKAKTELDGWDIEHISLPRSHADYGNTPRCLGALSAINLGFNPIIFLDADNWIDRDHVMDILSVKRKSPDADLVCTFRHLILPTGILLEPDPEDSLRRHVDTSCMAYFESAFFQLPLWATMTKPLSVIGDRFIYHATQQAGLTVKWTDRRSVFYTVNYRHHYVRAGQEPPSDTYVLNTEILKQFSSQQLYYWSRLRLSL